MTASNLNKLVRVESPLSFYMLTDIAPAWLEFSNTGNNQWTELIDTPGAILAGLVVQGDVGGTALEFGQALRATDNPTFADLMLTGDLTVDGTQTLINSTDVRIRDNNIILGNVLTPTDITADGGGITLLGDTDRTILWNDPANTWEVSSSLRAPFVNAMTAFIHGISGASWDSNGILLPANNSLSFDGGAVLSDAGGVVTLANIDQLDLTTQSNIENAMTGLPNLTSIQSLPIALADAGTDAIFGWADGGSTYRNLTPAEVLATIGIGGGTNIVTTSDTLTATQLLLGNGGTDIVTEPDLVWTGTKFGLGIASPISRMHIAENTSEIGPAAGLTIDQLGSGDAMLHLKVPGMRWIVGIDNTDGDKFKINDDSTFSTTGAMSISAVTQFVGLGTAFPVSRLHVTSSEADTAAVLSLQNTGANAATIMTFIGTRDPEGNVAANPGDVYYRDSGGVDSGIFIHKGSSFGTAGWEEVITGIAGNVTTSDTLLNNQLLTGNGGVDIVTEPTLTYDGSTLQIDLGGTFPTAAPGVNNFIISRDDNSGITIFSSDTNIGSIHFGDEAVNDAGIIRYDHNTDVMSFGTTGTPSVFIDNFGNVGLHINEPFSPLHVFDNSVATDFSVGTTIEQAGTGDALLQFILTDNRTWIVGIDNSDFDKFKIQSDAILGINPEITITTNKLVGINQVSPESPLHIRNNNSDDTETVLTIETNGLGKIGFRTGDRTPEGNVSGVGGDVYYADRGALSGTYESREASASTNWLKRSVLPADNIEILNSAEFDDLASGGIITISSDTTFVIRGQITTSNRIVINDFVTFHIVGDYRANSIITYTGSDNFLGGGGFVSAFASVTLASSSTGTLFDLGGAFPIVNFREMSIQGWDDLGTITGGGVFGGNSLLSDIGVGLKLINSVLVNMIDVGQSGADLNSPLFIIDSNNPNTIMSFTDINGINLGATGSLFDINTRLNNEAVVKISRVNAIVGDIFKPSTLSNVTINSVADGTIATGTITAMADNGAGGTTFSSTTTYFEDEEAAITGTTSYNGTFQIFNVVPGVSFDTITPFVANDATGSIDSARLVIDVGGGSGISAGDSLKLINSNFYNGFQTALLLSGSDLTVNGAFVATDTGEIVRELSLDESDPRISAMNNFGIADSSAIACAHVNDNSTANGTIVNNVFTDMVFGTIGVALRSSTSMERWRLIDDLNGTFEYFGMEPFDGNITFDFTVESTGGTVDFRFKWMVDEGSGFVDLPDDVESLVAVGGDAQSVTKTYPLKALKGHKIKPQITRNSGSSDITATYVTIFVRQ